MCGISVLISSREEKQISENIKKMSDIIHHRGPDDEGYSFFGSESYSVEGGKYTPKEVYDSSFIYNPRMNTNPLSEQILVAFGHKRLSIIDLSPGGHQPMCCPGNRYWITYNGEVFNYIEIKKELSLSGVSFITQSDTEVILQAYIAWGVKCLDRFNGMFSFAIYDRKEKKIFMARDRFGVKPLYYRISKDFFAAGSEIKQFTTLPDWKAESDHESVYDFLNWAVTDHNERTLFKGVFQLNGGHYILGDINRIKEGNFTPQKWYTLQPQKNIHTYEEACKHFGELFIDSVSKRLRADVPIGSCLSGGLDSSSIVCVIHDLLKSENCLENQKIFSAFSKNPLLNEQHFVDAVVGKCNANAYHTYPEYNDLIDNLSHIIWHQDIPFISTSIFAQWAVFKLVKDRNVRVVLDGQGADEILGGYHSYFGYRYHTLFSSFRWGALLKQMHSIKKVHGKSYGFPLLINRLLPDFARQPLLKFMNKPHNSPSWIDFSKLYVEKNPPFHSRMSKDMTSFGMNQVQKTNLPMLLRYEDRNSMNHSVEARTPFLDYRLVEYALGVQDEYKLRGAFTKSILRDSMHSQLPEQIRLRYDKKAFGTPEEDWMRLKPDFFEGLLKESCRLSAGMIKESEIVPRFRQMLSQKIPFDSLYWRVICFGQWQKIFKVSI